MSSKNPNLNDALRTEREDEASAHHAPGTVVLVMIFLVTFAVYYFANWKALADVWPVR